MTPKQNPYYLFAFVVAGMGDQTGSGTDEQQGGGEVIDNPQVADNPDGYLAEEDGAGVEAMPEQEVEAPKAEV